MTIAYGQPTTFALGQAAIIARGQHMTILHSGIAHDLCTGTAHDYCTGTQPTTIALRHPMTISLGQPMTIALGQPATIALGQSTSTALGQPTTINCTRTIQDHSSFKFKIGSKRHVHTEHNTLIIIFIWEGQDNLTWFNLCLLVSSADSYLCKQFGSRSGRLHLDSGSITLKEYFEKVDCEKKISKQQKA